MNIIEFNKSIQSLNNYKDEIMKKNRKNIIDFLKGLYLTDDFTENLESNCIELNCSCNKHFIITQDNVELLLENFKIAKKIYDDYGNRLLCPVCKDCLPELNKNILQQQEMIQKFSNLIL